MGRRRTVAVVASVGGVGDLSGALLWSFISPSGQLNESRSDRDSGALCPVSVTGCTRHG